MPEEGATLQNPKGSMEYSKGNTSLAIVPAERHLCSKANTSMTFVPAERYLKCSATSEPRSGRRKGLAAREWPCLFSG